MREESQTISRDALQERRCKRCGRLLRKGLVLVDGVSPGFSATQFSGDRIVEILDEIVCPKCGYKNFFHDKY